MRFKTYHSVCTCVAKPSSALCAQSQCRAQPCKPIKRAIATQRSLRAQSQAALFKSNVQTPSSLCVLNAKQRSLCKALPRSTNHTKLINLLFFYIYIYIYICIYIYAYYEYYYFKDLHGSTFKQMQATASLNASFAYLFPCPSFPCTQSPCPSFPCPPFPDSAANLHASS
jgi:hypothetical protein